jgi:DNA repair ATPase RecN
MTKFEETVKEMESQVEELETELAEKAEKLNEENKEIARALVNKTEEAIKSSIEKVKGIINDVQNDEKLDEFLDKVKAKSMEAVDFTKAKVNELTQKYDKENKLDKLGEDIMTEFDKIKESDAFKKAADFLNDLSGKITEFFEKDEVKDAINKAKTTTVKVAEMGVENLKKVLKTDEIPAEAPKEATEETPAEEPKE